MSSNTGTLAALNPLHPRNLQQRVLSLAHLDKQAQDAALENLRATVVALLTIDLIRDAKMISSTHRFAVTDKDRAQYIAARQVTIDDYYRLWPKPEPGQLPALPTGPVIDVLATAKQIKPAKQT